MRLYRRIAAGMLLMLAVALYFRGTTHEEESIAVVIAARDLTSGTTLRLEDTKTVHLPKRTLPTGALINVQQSEGKQTAGPIRSGEILTDYRLLSATSATAATGKPDAQLVPVALSDPLLADLLQEGNIVDVVAVLDNAARNVARQHDDAELADPEQSNREQVNVERTVIASRAVVVLVSKNPSKQSRNPGYVLLALPKEQAHHVAAVALTHSVTITLQ